jgi:dual specificity protein kinase YAK1
MEQYSREHGSKEQPSKKYFSATTLPDIIKNYPMPRKNMKPAEIERGQ